MPATSSSDVQVGRFRYEHIVPAALTEDASLETCQVLCRPCHAAKTVVEVGVVARVRRVRDRHAGIIDPHRRPLLGGEASPFKRLIGGGVIRRDTGEWLDKRDRCLGVEEVLAGLEFVSLLLDQRMRSPLPLDGALRLSRHGSETDPLAYR